MNILFFYFSDRIFEIARILMKKFLFKTQSDYSKIIIFLYLNLTKTIIIYSLEYLKIASIIVKAI